MFVAYVAKDEWWNGFPGSRAQGEASESEVLGGEAREIALRSAYSLMNVSLFATIQHVESIAALLETNNPPAYAITVVARSAIEIVARAWWLADPSLDATGRIRRALIERLASALEVDRLEAAGHLQRGELGAPPTVDALVSEIEGLGFTCNPRNGSVDGDMRLGATNLIAAFLKADTEKGHRTIYRLLSAVAHGTLWGLMIFFSGEPDESKRTAATYRVTQNWLDGPACTVALGVAAGIKRIGQLLDWDPEPIEGFLRRADDLFGKLPE